MFFPKRNMTDADAPDSSFVEKLKELLTKYGTELLKPYVFHEELFRRLDKLEHLLANTHQKHKKLVEMLLQPSIEALIMKDFIRHSELEVRVSVASCISQIIRITAPDEPFGDDDMKEFFQIAISAFERLPCMYGRTYSKAMSILKTMSRIESCVMMLDLGLYGTVGHMFHLFLDGIRTKHPHRIFSSMEKIMTATIRNNDDNDELSLVLTKILLDNLRRENQKDAPLSFKLAENTLKNCSADLKTYIPEAVGCLDIPIEDYADIVASLFQDATQKQIMDLKDTVENVSCPGEAGLAAEAQDDENYNENRGMISHCLDDPDKLGKSVHMQQEQQKPEEIHIGRKRNRRPNSLKKADEGYDPFWMLIDWRSLKSLNKKKNVTCPAKAKSSKGLSPKPSGEDVGTSISPKPVKIKKKFARNAGVSANKALKPTSEGKIVMLEDQTKDISIKSRSEEGQGGSLTKVPSLKKSRRKAIVPEGLKEDILTEKGQGSLTEMASVKKRRRKAIVSEDLNEDILSRSEGGQGGSLTKVASLKKSRRKTIVPEGLKEDILTLASQCRSMSSQAKAQSVEVSKQNPNGSVPLLKKRLRTATGSVSEEVVGRRIKVWWPLDQKFYKGTIKAFDPLYKAHQVDYDDGEIEILDLTREVWKLLHDSNLSPHEPENGETSSSSKSKLV